MNDLRLWFTRWRQGVAAFRSRWAQRLPVLDLYLTCLLVLLSLLLCYRLADPKDSLIFDETYYVQDARVILGQPVSPTGLPETWYSGGDPNSEHPPLAKLIIAAGIQLFQENGVGWRLPSVLLGLLSVAAVYGIVRTLGRDRGQARLAATILAFDNLFFVHSRIATLDIYLVAFSLIGVWLFLRRRYEYSGLMMGLATVCKINALFTAAALCAYECLQTRFWRRENRWLPVKPLLLFLSFYTAFTFFVLGSLDCYWTEFRSPVAHVVHIFKFGASLTRTQGVGPQGVESTPLQWWMNDKVFDYFTLTTTVEGNSWNPIQFQGRMSNYVIAAAPFALVFCAIEACRGSTLGMLVVCLFFFNYGAVFGSWVTARRICYIYYMVPCLPPFAIGISSMLERCPRWVRYTFVATLIYSFIYLFPFRGEMNTPDSATPSPSATPVAASS